MGQVLVEVSTRSPVPLGARRSGEAVFVSSPVDVAVADISFSFFFFFFLFFLGFTQAFVANFVVAKQQSSCDAATVNPIRVQSIQAR